MNLPSASIRRASNRRSRAGGGDEDFAARELIRERVTSEFDEMPGMALTLPQATRLFDLPEDLCLRLLLGLVAEGVLVQGPDGAFRRRQPSL